MNSPTSSSRSAPKAAPRRRPFPRSAFAVFLVVGLVVLYLTVGRPLQQVAAARNWKETPCTVSSSRVVPVGNPRHGIQSYRIAILYHYNVHGVDYGTDRYQFDNSASSGQEDKQRIVDQYPPGRKTVCYVDPEHPSQAVLSRSPNGEMRYGLIGVAFAAMGVVGLFYSRRPTGT